MDIDNLFQNLLQPLLAYVEINLQLQGFSATLLSTKPRS